MFIICREWNWRRCPFNPCSVWVFWAIQRMWIPFCCISAEAKKNVADKFKWRKSYKGWNACPFQTKTNIEWYEENVRWGPPSLSHKVSKALYVYVCVCVCVCVCVFVHVSMHAYIYMLHNYLTLHLHFYLGETKFQRQPEIGGLAMTSRHLEIIQEIWLS